MPANSSKGLYANIHAKKARIKAGSGEKMRAAGSKGAPSKSNFAQAEKTAKMAKGGVSLAIGRGEKLPASQGAGLTAKGRAKYNRETGRISKLRNRRVASEKILSALAWVLSLRKARKEAAPEHQ
jgi:hypothetical protein